MAKQDYFAAKNELMFMCKQNYPSVMEAVHRSIDCENGSNDQKSLSYTIIHRDRDGLELWETHLAHHAEELLRLQEVRGL